MDNRKHKIWAEDVILTLADEVAGSAIPVIFAIFLSGKHSVKLDMESLARGLKQAGEDYSEQHIINQLANSYFALRAHSVGLTGDSFFDSSLVPKSHIVPKDFALLIESWATESAPYVDAMRGRWEEEEPKWIHSQTPHWPLAEKILAESQKSYVSGGLGRVFV